jgi:hypothetical protein
MRKISFLTASLTLATALLAACGGGNKTSVVSSRAYKGHETERDTTNFVNAHPQAVGTRLDDCQTCHKRGTFTNNKGKTVEVAACSYCHLVQHPDTTLVSPAVPATIADTLNAYGAAYLAGGKTKQALLDLDGQDSDGDGYTNGAEIADGRYPGDASSMPGLPAAPTRSLGLADLEAMPAHSEFLLANSSKQQFDEYVTYSGVKIRDLLNGIKPGLADDPGVAGITVISPDGFIKSRTTADINTQYPAGKYYAGLDTAHLGEICGYVKYPNTIPETSIGTDGVAILDEQWLMLAYERDGAPLDPSNLDPTSGKINGEGPYRFVVPQKDLTIDGAQISPGMPDRGQDYPTDCSNGLEYVATGQNESQAQYHNAGDMARGVIAIRIDPMPAGYEEFDYRNGGWAYIPTSTLIVYGYGVQ